MRNLGIKALIYCSVFTATICIGAISANASNKLSKKTKTEYVALETLIDFGTTLYIKKSDLSPDLSIKENVELNLKLNAERLLTSSTLPTNIRIEFYSSEEDGQKSFLSVVKPIIRRVKDIENVNVHTNLVKIKSSQDIYCDIYNDYNEIAGSYKIPLEITNAETTTSLENKALTSSDCSGNFGSCHVEYILKAINFSSVKPVGQQSEVIKNIDGTYDIKAPYKLFKFKKRKKKKKKLKLTNSNVVNDGPNLLASTIQFKETSLVEPPVDGLLEYDGEKLYFTIAGERSEFGAKGEQGEVGPPGSAGSSGSGGNGATSIDDLSDAVADADAIFLGSNAGAANAGTTYNTALGVNTLTNADADTLRNIAIGYNAANALNDGDENIAIGYNGLSLVTSGSYNLAIGNHAQQDNVTASYNTAIGYNSMKDNTGGLGLNVAIGYNSMRDITTGAYNTAVGTGAGVSNETGTNNTYVGRNAGAGAFGQSHANNAFFGNESGYLITTGGANTCLGNKSCDSVTTGSGNITVGNEAGENLSTGSNNIIIGNLVNAPVATADDQLNIGDTIYGDLSTDSIGIGISPQRAMHISDVMRLEPRSAAPAAPALGDIYVDSDSNEICFYNGAIWIGLAAAGACS